AHGRALYYGRRSCPIATAASDRPPPYWRGAATRRPSRSRTLEPPDRIHQPKRTLNTKKSISSSKLYRSHSKRIDTVSVSATSRPAPNRASVSDSESLSDKTVPTPATVTVVLTSPSP